mmetsp:Transcript_17793/g.46020  ORF Transcript_17793/g.46020 Transcript_17793/m.46020 type:complete len:210 (+) Transcript_17793:96-725(+)
MEPGPHGAARNVKVVVLGASGVGKSSIVSRFVHNAFAEDEQTTIGAAFASRVLTVGSTSYALRIWDTAGQEKYQSLAPMYYRGAMAAIVVFDLTHAASFRTMKHWISELTSHGPRAIAVAIVGNKRDRLSDGMVPRAVEEADARAYATSIDALYTEVSAKVGDGIDELFVELCMKLSPQTQISATPTFITPHSQSQRAPSLQQSRCCAA